MKPGKIHIVLWIMLIVAGCGRDEKHRHYIQPPSPPPAQVIDRFTEDHVDIDHYTFIDTIKGDTLPYYIAEWPIEKTKRMQAVKVYNTQMNEYSVSYPVYRFEGASVNHFFRRGIISDKIAIGLIFDNDIIDYTDYYYTSGLSFEFFHPSIAGSPFSILLPGLTGSLNYYWLSLEQHLYTPRKLDEWGVQTGDRPFAAYLNLTHHRVSLSPEKHRRLETSLTLGVIGPAAMGGSIQKLFHEDEPVGWVNQISNDIVVNYGLRYDVGIFTGRALELTVYAGGQAGTLYDNVMAGVYMQAGKSNGRFSSIFLTTPHQSSFRQRIRYFMTLDLQNRLIIYDATLQGGMANHNSVYTLGKDQINKYVFLGKAGIGIGLGRYSLEAEQVYLTPEFEGGRHHLWFRIRNVYSF